MEALFPRDLGLKWFDLKQQDGLPKKAPINLAIDFFVSQARSNHVTFSIYMPSAYHGSPPQSVHR